MDVNTFNLKVMGLQFLQISDEDHPRSCGKDSHQGF